MAAMKAHETQISIDGPFFALSNNLGLSIWGDEYYTLVKGDKAAPFDADGRELDLLKAPAPKRAANAQQLELLDLRAKARGAGDYAESDRLRDLLKVEGIEVRDNSDGQSWSWLI